MIWFRFFLDFAKEEKWLNEMARNGYELVGVSVVYTFQRCDPRDILIRVDNRMFRSKGDFNDYCAMFEDSGWQHIAGTKNSGTQYFRRIAENSDEDIFSDRYSKAERYRRLSRMWIYLALYMLFLFGVLLATGTTDLHTIIQPRLVYLTPGLWEKTGVEFWRAFWFETPFAILRAFSIYFFPISLIMYAFFAFKSHRLYLQGLSDETLS